MKLLAEAEHDLLRSVYESANSFVDIKDIVDEEIQTELVTLENSGFDFSLLSSAATATIWFVFKDIIIPLWLVLFVIPQVQEVIDKTQPCLVSVGSAHEVSNRTKHLTSDEKHLLRSCRVVTGNNLRLRESPSLKSEIITTLPNGKIIQVLDSSELSWLKVEVDIDDEPLEGWVARRYTDRIK